MEVALCSVALQVGALTILFPADAGPVSSSARALAALLRQIRRCVIPLQTMSGVIHLDLDSSDDLEKPAFASPPFPRALSSAPLVLLSASLTWLGPRSVPIDLDELQKTRLRLEEVETRIVELNTAIHRLNVEKVPSLCSVAPSRILSALSY